MIGRSLPRKTTGFNGNLLIPKRPSSAWPKAAMYPSAKYLGSLVDMADQFGRYQVLWGGTALRQSVPLINRRDSVIVRGRGRRDRYGQPIVMGRSIEVIENESASFPAPSPDWNSINQKRGGICSPLLSTAFCRKERGRG